MKRAACRSWALLSWALGGVLVVAAGIGLFLLLFQRVEEEVELGPGPAARVNPYLAAERLLTALGVETKSVRGPVRLPPADHALVLVTPRQVFGAARVEQLLAWVGRGGHLITAPRAPGAEGEDLLLSRLALALALPAAGAEDEEAEDAEDEDAEDEDAEDEDLEVVSVAPAAGASPLDVEVGAPRFAAASEDADFAAGDVLVRYRWEQGWITVLADAAFLENGRIGRHDHARFLWSLVTTPQRPAGVWLVYRDYLPGLRRLLVARAWMALASAALLLAAWLWARGARFGPPLPPPAAERRSLREHLEATAEFLWRQGHGGALAAGERQAVLHAAARQHPAWVELPEREKIRYLAELAGVPGGVVAEALHGEVSEEPAAWTRVIATLEKVRRSL